MEYLYLAGIVLLIAAICWITYRYAKYALLVRKEKEIVKLRRSTKIARTWLICACIWMLNCGFRIGTSTDKIKKIDSGFYDDQRRNQTQSIEAYRDELRKPETRDVRIYTLLGAFWLFDAVLCIAELARFHDQYVTPKGVYYPDGFKAAEQFTYQIEGDTLMLWRKSKTPEKYTIIEEREQLLQKLTAHYQPHGQNPS